MYTLRCKLMFKKSLGYDKIKHKLNNTLHVVNKRLINNINSIMIYCIKIKNSVSL